MFLSHCRWRDPAHRDCRTWADLHTLLRLLVKEQDAMDGSREHFENGERRVSEGRDRIARQRRMLAALMQQEQAERSEAQLLATLERTQVLLEQHLRRLRQLQDRTPAQRIRQAR